MDLMVPVGGGEVWVRDSGGPGVPAVLIHPGWGDSEIWDECAALLEGRVRTVRYDSLGYGESSAPTARYTALDELRAVLDRLGIERAVLAGHSGGAGTALGLALAEPLRVAELVLLAPGVSGYPWPGDDPFLEAMRVAERGRDLEGMVSLGLLTWAPAGAGEAVEAQIRSAVSGMRQQAPYLDEDPPAYERLDAIRAPSTLLYGDLEYPMAADCARALAARIPGCRVRTVPGADHMLPLRVPGLIAELIAKAVVARSG